uniref:Uncharacterized protein n=1 Tax=Colobus angolensis palliatus TaxID=336983 RepID=A0A2K5J890_COLAP
MKHGNAVWSEPSSHSQEKTDKSSCILANQLCGLFYVIFAELQWVTPPAGFALAQIHWPSWLGFHGLSGQCWLGGVVAARGLYSQLTNALIARNDLPSQYCSKLLLPSLEQIPQYVSDPLL